MGALSTEDWLKQYRGLVEADGRNYPTVRAEGSDSTVWGTWSTKTNGDDIDAYLAALGSDLPTGHHAFKLVVYDEQNRQVGALPRNVHGSSREAKAAQQTSLDQAKAHAVLATASESAVNAANAQRDILEKKYFDCIENVGTLVDTCISLAQRAELREAEQESRIARNMAMQTLCEQAGPLFQVAAHIAKRRFDIWDAEQQSKPKPPPGQAPESKRRSTRG